MALLDRVEHDMLVLRVQSLEGEILELRKYAPAPKDERADLELYESGEEGFVAPEAP